MSHDSWVHRIVRVSVRPLVDSPIRPNHLTTLRLLSGLAAAAAFAEGSAQWREWGVWIFLASLFLDHADGELARMSGKSSRWGHIYDLITDGLCNAGIFIGLGVGLHGGVLDAWALPMGVIAGFAIILVFAMTFSLEARLGPRAGELGGIAGFDPDQGMLLVPIALWLGWAPWLLAAAAFGAPAFALFYAWKFRRGFQPRRV